MLTTQDENFYINQFKSINELIEKFNYIFNTIQKSTIETLAKNFLQLEKEFNSKYLRYINIKRFTIPVIGRISSGKSTFLNAILGLNNILESNTDITTKFVCIIRHNQLLDKPKIYSVKLEERKEKQIIKNENSKPKFNFEKGEELEGDIKEIISNRNEYINKTQNELLNKEDFFMIIETKIPIFNKDMIQYSEIFEFMDLPGLNEKEGDDSFFNKNILPVISNNTKFSFFIFDYSAIKDKDTFKVYESFIKLFDIKIENCIYILNKIDLIDLSKNKKEDEINYFINSIKEKYKVDIDKNHFLPINSYGLKKNNNFNSYLHYTITEAQNENTGSFIAYLKKKMEKDLNIKIDLSKCEIPISNLKDSEIKELIDTFNVDIQSKNFMKSSNKDNYLKFSGIFNNYNREGLNNDIKEISEKLFSSMKNTIESFTNLNNYEKELNDFQNKLNNNKLNDNYMVEFEKLKKRMILNIQLKK